MRRMILFYPLLLAAFPVIFLASQNRDEVFIPQVATALVVVLAVTLALILFLRLFIKDNAKVAAIVSVILVIFFSYGHIYEMTKSIVAIGLPILGNPTLIILAAVVGIGSIWGILQFKGDLALPMHCIAGAALLLVIVNIGLIGLYTVTASQSKVANHQSKNRTVSLTSPSQQLPDIYYIIFDGYARADVLKEIHKFDNSEVLDFLKSRGFYIASESRSNYNHTRFSLASSLNMRYLEDVRWRDLVPLYENNEVLKFTRGLGYKIVHFDSTWRWTAQNPNADIEISNSDSLWGSRNSVLMNDFSEALLQSTAAKVLNLERFYSESAAETFHYNVKMLRNIPEMPEHTFSFVHFTLPHPPYVFDRDGQVLSESRYPNPSKRDWRMRELYVDEIIYLNKVIQEVVDDILAQSTVEPIIIIQGDHGSKSISRKRKELHAFESTGILNVYYLPEYCRSGLYPSISPVNSFRAVFNSCFGANFELLEDKAHLGTESDDE
jgi:sulfatase-like protein